MKKADDPRHLKREKAVRSLFEWSFGQIPQARHPLAHAVLKQREKIDAQIVKRAPEWPLEQINKVDLAILRLAIYELMIKPNEPPKVIIDEAVELGKKYGSEKSSSFINGVLGSVLKQNEPSEN